MLKLYITFDGDVLVVDTTRPSNQARQRNSYLTGLAHEHDALCTLHMGMYLHDHHTCAHPEHSESVSFMPSRK